MNISIIGTGYVGLVTGACLAKYGHNIVCMDSDNKKIEQLKSGILTIYEPDLEYLVKRGMASGHLTFTADIRTAVEHGDIIFIAVCTPTLSNNLPDLQYVMAVVRDIALNMSCYKIIVSKSTVPVGTGQQIIQEVRKILDSRNLKLDFDVASNPEFLREGSAVKDFLKPDRIIMGTTSEYVIKKLREIYRSPVAEGVPVIVTDLATAEMIKYASNAFLAAKISFINDIANMCELCNADVRVVSLAMGLDSRIGHKFLNPGPGYGGSCFPKDTKALMGIGEKLGYIPLMVKSTIEVNERQPMLMFNKILKASGSVAEKTVTILGIAFKPETDDIRESPIIPVIRSLIDNNAVVRLYDPQAAHNAAKALTELQIEYCNDIYTACQGSDCIVLATEWPEFNRVDYKKLFSMVNTPIFIDLRNMLDPERIREAGFYYEGIGFPV